MQTNIYGKILMVVNYGKIIINKARCKKCGDIIESKDLNDFKRCACGSIAVDGGHYYIKRIGNKDDIIELSKVENIVTGEITNKLK